MSNLAAAAAVRSLFPSSLSSSSFCVHSPVRKRQKETNAAASPATHSLHSDSVRLRSSSFDVIDMNAGEREEEEVNAAVGRSARPTMRGIRGIWQEERKELASGYEGQKVVTRLV